MKESHKRIRRRNYGQEQNMEAKWKQGLLVDFSNNSLNWVWLHLRELHK